MLLNCSFIDMLAAPDAAHQRQYHQKLHLTVLAPHVDAESFNHTLTICQQESSVGSCLNPQRHACSSLCYQGDQDLEVTMEAAKDAGVTVVSLPLVNQWTQVSHHELLGTQTCH